MGSRREPRVPLENLVFRMWIHLALPSPRGWEVRPRGALEELPSRSLFHLASLGQVHHFRN